MFRGIHNVDYVQRNAAASPLYCNYRNDIPEGTWLSFATVAYLVGCSQQTIHLLYITSQIKALKFPRGPLLANLEEVEALKAEHEALRV